MTHTIWQFAKRVWSTFVFIMLAVATHRPAFYSNGRAVKLTKHAFSHTSEAVSGTTRLDVAILEMTGRYEDAISRGGVLLDHRANDEIARVLVDRALRADGRPVEAGRLWWGQPQTEQLVVELRRAALTHWANNDLPGAERILRGAITMEPLDCGVWSDLGNLLIWQPERHADQVTALSEAVRLSPPGSAVFFRNLGRLEFVLGRYREAAAAFVIYLGREDSSVDRYLLHESTRLLQEHGSPGSG